MRISREALKRHVSTDEILNFVKGHDEVRKWVLGFRSNSLRDVHVRNLIFYCEATGVSPSNLVELEERQRGGTLYRFVTEAESIFGVGNARVWGIAITVKNFYSWEYGMDDLAFIKLQHKLGRDI